jgi:hypothetical protein
MACDRCPKINPFQNIGMEALTGHRCADSDEHKSQMLWPIIDAGISLHQHMLLLPVSAVNGNHQANVMAISMTTTGW